MDSKTSWPRTIRERLATTDDAILSDYRERRAFEALELAERKRVGFAEQYSAVNSPDARIRAWEKVHHLCMPADPMHPVLDAIATATQLTLADVRNEQRLRAARRASAGV